VAEDDHVAAPTPAREAASWRTLSTSSEAGSHSAPSTWRGERPLSWTRSRSNQRRTPKSLYAPSRSERTNASQWMRAASSSGHFREPVRYRPRLTDEVPASAASSSRSKTRNSSGTSRSGKGDSASESSSRPISTARRSVPGSPFRSATAASRPMPAAEASRAILRRSSRSRRSTLSCVPISPSATARRSNRNAGSTTLGRSSGGSTVEIWRAAIYQRLTEVALTSSRGCSPKQGRQAGYRNGFGHHPPPEAPPELCAFDGYVC
jgi:hypothetical protein